MKNMNCVSTMPEIMPEITDEAIIEALFAQRPYEEKVINSAFLEIPAEYQRKLNIPNVEKMSAEFTELIANPPKVSYRDGHYFVFDGQHTIVTRRAMNGGQDLPIICKVYEGLTEEEEAMLFSRQTGVSTPLTAGAELRAALVGKDPESLAFVKATESTGLQLGLDSYRAPWKIICIRTAFKEYKTYGADLYKEALTMLAKGWEGDPDSLRSGILQGMVRFVALYQGEYDPERLVKRLPAAEPEGQVGGQALSLPHSDAQTVRDEIRDVFQRIRHEPFRVRHGRAHFVLQCIDLRRLRRGAAAQGDRKLCRLAAELVEDLFHPAMPSKIKSYFFCDSSINAVFSLVNLCYNKKGIFCRGRAPAEFPRSPGGSARL